MNKVSGNSLNGKSLDVYGKFNLLYLNNFIINLFKMKSAFKKPNAIFFNFHYPNTWYSKIKY